MNDLKRGVLVRHASLGVGKVVATEPGAVHVFFAAGGKRVATKLRLAFAGPLLTAVGAEGNAWLAGLPSFVHDSKSGRYGLAGNWLSHEEALAHFLEAFPKGFTDPAYCGVGALRRERASRWRRAHEAFVEAFGHGEAERLLAVGDVVELATRALRVERHVRTMQKACEKEVLERALQDAVAGRLFFAALFDFLAAPAPEAPRFEALAVAVALLPGGASEAGWPLVTLFPFIAQPDRHMLLRPAFTCEAAQRLGLDLRYESEPNWATYAALLRSSEHLLEELRSMGARDLIDVESFLHVATAKPGERRSSTQRLVT
jgi:hypothetical protein